MPFQRYVTVVGSIYISAFEHCTSFIVCLNQNTFREYNKLLKFLYVKYSSENQVLIIKQEKSVYDFVDTLKHEVHTNNTGI